MDLSVINDQGQQVTSVTASDETFGREYNEALVHQLVMASKRNGPCPCRPYFQPDLARRWFGAPQQGE